MPRHLSCRAGGRHLERNRGRPGQLTRTRRAAGRVQLHFAAEGPHGNASSRPGLRPGGERRDGSTSLGARSVGSAQRRSAVVGRRGTRGHRCAGGSTSVSPQQLGPSLAGRFGSRWRCAACGGGCVVGAPPVRHGRAGRRRRSRRHAQGGHPSAAVGGCPRRSHGQGREEEERRTREAGEGGTGVARRGVLVECAGAEPLRCTRARMRRGLPTAPPRPCRPTHPVAPQPRRPPHSHRYQSRIGLVSQ